MEEEKKTKENGHGEETPKVEGWENGLKTWWYEQASENSNIGLWRKDIYEDWIAKIKILREENRKRLIEEIQKRWHGIYDSDPYRMGYLQALSDIKDAINEIYK